MCFKTLPVISILHSQVEHAVVRATNSAVQARWQGDMYIPAGVTTASTQFLGLTLMPYFVKFSMTKRIVVQQNSSITRFLIPT